LAFLPIRSKNGAAPLFDLAVGFRWSRGSHGGWRDGGEKRGKEYGLAIFNKSKGFWMMCMYVCTCMVISSLNTFLLKASDFYTVYVKMINLLSPKLVLFTRRKYQKRGQNVDVTGRWIHADILHHWYRST
jgi:hypothetical protein